MEELLINIYGDFPIKCLIENNITRKINRYYTECSEVAIECAVKF